MTVREFLDALRQGTYSSVGCYPLFFLTDDGETLSVKSARENVWRIARAIRDDSRDGWRVVAHDVNWEDPEMFCCDSGERIQSAYAEDQAEILDALRACEDFDGTLKSARKCLTNAGKDWNAVKDDVDALYSDGRLDGWS